MLPMHPQPQQDEILSSWLVRLAFANGFPLHTFYSTLLGYKAPIWSRDIDRHPPRAMLKVLKKYTQTPIAALETLALSSYEGILFEQLPMTGDAPWILPAGVFHRTRLRAGMQFCPLCLQHDLTPYYRRSWRLALYSVCTHHHCLMQQYCPSCQSPVIFHRHGIGRSKVIPEEALRLCHLCGFNLGSADPIYVEWPTVKSRQLLLVMLSMIDMGEWRPGSISPSFGVLFFQGLRILIGVISGRNGMRLRQVLSKILGMKLESVLHKDFEYQETSVRLKLLLATMWMLEDWPNQFLQLCSSAHFTRSRLTDYFPSIPFWLASVVDRHLDTRPYLPGVGEIVEAGNYLIAHSMNVTSMSLAELLNLKRDVARRAHKIWQLQLGCAP